MWWPPANCSWRWRAWLCFWPRPPRADAGSRGCRSSCWPGQHTASSTTHTAGDHQRQQLGHQDSSSTRWQHLGLVRLVGMVAIELPARPAHRQRGQHCQLDQTHRRRSPAAAPRPPQAITSGCSLHQGSSSTRWQHLGRLHLVGVPRAGADKLPRRYVLPLTLRRQGTGNR